MHVLGLQARSKVSSLLSAHLLIGAYTLNIEGHKSMYLLTRLKGNYYVADVMKYLHFMGVYIEN